MNDKILTNYFTDRSQAGQIIVERLAKYRYEDTIVLALSDGAVLVGAEIAKRLHSLISLLLVRDIYLPDGRTIIGSVDEVGSFVYNNAFSAGQLEELDSEYRSYIEQAKMQALHELHIVLGQGGEISNNYFRNRVVIVVSDGLLNGAALDMAYDFLKKIAIKQLVMATPIASVEAVDRMHLLADEIVCLNVIDSGLPIEHYYDDNKMPNRNEIVNTLNDIIIHWNQEKNLT